MTESLHRSGKGPEFGSRYALDHLPGCSRGDPMPPWALHLTCAHAHTETHILKSENKSQGSDSSLQLVTHLALSTSLVICRVGPLLSS